MIALAQLTWATPKLKKYKSIQEVYRDVIC